MTSHRVEDFIRLIRAQGYRATPQRQLILAAILAGQGHTTIEEIYARVQAIEPRVNLVTVYRNLDFLCELRIVVAADIGGGHWVYEIAGDTPHHHLICRTCGQVQQITQDEVVDFIEQINSRFQFRIDMDHMALFGLCARCRINSQEER